jgi:hypothetical protein
VTTIGERALSQPAGAPRPWHRIAAHYSWPMQQPEIHDDEPVQEPTSTGTRGGATLAVAGLVLIGVVLISAESSRVRVGEPPETPAPTFSRNDSSTSLPTEVEAWGEIWSRANGIAVLRPTWLPKSEDKYQVTSSVTRSSQGLLEYDMSYIEQRTPPGATVWRIEFMANPLEDPAGRLIQLGGVLETETVMVRGQVAALKGIHAPLLWQLVWTEGQYRYAIQAFATSREDLLRIANSLALVIDDTGRT